MAMATASAPWTATARSSRRTRFFPFCFGISPERGNSPGDLAKTFSTTKLLDKIAARFGRRVHEVPVGFKYICELMLERDILLGGEESGGIGTQALSARSGTPRSWLCCWRK